MRIIKRKQAALIGMKKYYTGVRCVRGHDDFRYVNSGACTSCVSFYTRSLRKRKKEQPLVTQQDQITLRLRVYCEHVKLIQRYATWLRMLKEM